MDWFAQTTAPWALFGIILVSALGALTMCLLVFRYGLPHAEEDLAASSRHTVLITRVGHALAGACFAIAILLAIVVAASTRPMPVSVPPASSVELSDLEDLRVKVAATETQLTSAEARLSVTAAEAEAERSRVADLESRVRAAEGSLRRVTEDTARALATASRLSATAQSRRSAEVGPNMRTSNATGAHWDAGADQRAGGGSHSRSGSAGR
jgi:hypothetical protein